VKSKEQKANWYLSIGLKGEKIKGKFSLVKKHKNEKTIKELYPKFKPDFEGWHHQLLHTGIRNHAFLSEGSSAVVESFSKWN